MPLAQRVLRCPRLPLELMRVAPLAHPTVGTAGRSRLFRRLISALLVTLGSAAARAAADAATMYARRAMLVACTVPMPRACPKSCERPKTLVPVCASSELLRDAITSYKAESDAAINSHLQHRDAACQTGIAFTAAGQCKGTQHHSCLQPGEARRPHVCSTYVRCTLAAAQPQICSLRIPSTDARPSLRHRKRQ